MTRLRNTPHLVVVFASSLLLAVVSFTSTFAQRPPRAHEGNAGAPQHQARAPKAFSSRSERPRLVLLIVVDQFRYDYLEKYGDLFVQTGLRRLMREGASWTQANFDHMPTYTAPGHIAPTLAAALRIQAPSNCTGRVLMEARKDSRTRRAAR
ncbi:MAG: alkaline phosphatase family protein [Pyrinomonadaceae bacterium]